ncbi:MAG: response regulator [Phenylobacterium sp.]
MSKEILPRLLVVDDIADNREILRRRFTRLGYEVIEASGGKEALELIADQAFDLVLLDIMMPDIDGLEVLRQVRVTHSQAALPIIMVTGKSASEDVVEALALGANDYITKPVDLDVAYARAEMQVRRKREEDQSKAAFRELEQTLAQLKGAVTQAENKSALLADIGAEVRTPLTGILNTAGVLTRICDTPDLKKMIAVIETAAESLDKLMVDALETGDRRAPPPPKGRIRVLSADDDIARRQSVRLLFAEAKVIIELVEAPSGKEAAMTAKAANFDLILMDLEMPDGVDSIHAIREEERRAGLRRTPILAVSDDPRAAAKASSAGADLHMPKKITAAGLLTVLAAALSRESEDLSAVA